MIPQMKRILSQDFPEDVRSWIHNLIIPINQFMTNTTTLLNKGLTFQDHMNAEIKTIRLSSTDQPILAHRLKSKPIGVLVIRSEEEITAPLCVDWTNTEGGCTISDFGSTRFQVSGATSERQRRSYP